MCAAPGGKSSLLLSYLSDNSVLLSNEMVGKRNVILYENAVKWGAANHIITQNRSSDFEAFRHYFDVVMIDAPCSGEGMFRKDSDAIAQWSDGLVKQCSIVQKDIIQHSIELVADGGMLIYSTCTFEEAENEDMLAGLYETYGDMLEPVEIPIQAAWGMSVVEINIGKGKTQKGYYCYPHKVKGEGQFISAIRVHSGKRTILKAGAGLQKLNKDGNELIKQYAKLPENHAQAMWGDKVITYPQHLHNVISTAIQKMYVKKAGTTLGLITRDTFIPDHEMAMDKLVADNIPKVELNIEAALDYMQRKSASVADDVPKGWIIFTYKGLPIGWAKNLGSRVNIHYPSNWRIRKEPNYEDL
jgi:NOL1/NOP2/fmu family ribosome biogenesis protein